MKGLLVVGAATVLLLGMLGMQSTALGLHTTSAPSTNPQGVGVNIVFEEKKAGDYVQIEATWSNGSASFSASAGEDGKGYVCCIEYPAKVKVWHVFPDGAKRLAMTFTISASAAPIMNYTITLHKDDGISLTVEKKK